MSNFPYAVAFNLTFLQQADEGLLKQMGMNSKRVRAMIGETFYFKQQKLKKDTAEYWYSFRVNRYGRTRDHRNTMVSDPSVLELTDNQTILLAAHELKHCERRTRQGKGTHLGLIGGMIGALAGFVLTRDGIASVIGGLLGYALGQGARNAMTYNEEVLAFRHMEIMAYILGMPTRHVDNQPKRSGKIRHLSWTDYPNTATITQIKYETQQHCVRNAIPVYAPEQVQRLHALTRTHIANKKLQFVQM